MEYYIKVGEEKRGPYSLNELVERNLESTTLVMPTDGTEWVQANQIEELRTRFENKESTNEAANKEEIPFVEARPILQATPQEENQQPQHAPKEEASHWLSLGFAAFIRCLDCNDDNYLSKGRTAQGSSLNGYNCHRQRRCQRE